MTNTITKTALALLTGLTATVAGPAQAGYMVDGYHLMDGSDFVGNERLAWRMIEDLAEMGIPVLDGGKEKLEICEERDENGYGTLGFYIPAMDVMAICTQNTGYGDQAFETFTHEVVHVIQDARDGLDNETLGEGTAPYLRNLANDMDERTFTFITEAYGREDWATELEAFYFQDRPEVVANELTRWAF